MKEDKPRKPRKKKPGHWATRYIGFKLYDEDAEQANYVADHSNLTDLLTSAIRLKFQVLHKFYEKTLPEHIQYREPRAMTETKQILVEVRPETWNQFVKAHQKIEKALGKSPGPEFLMTLILEREDPLEVVDTYIDSVLQHLESQKFSLPRGKSKKAK